MGREVELPPDYESGPPPTRMIYLWAAFWNISAGRSLAAMVGMLPLGWPDVAAWMQATGTRLRQHEVLVVFQLDRIYLSMQERPKK